MKIIFCVLLIIPLSLFAFEKNDSTTLKQNQLIRQQEINENYVKIFKEKLKALEGKIEMQENLNEKTINGISNQLNAASYNLTIFGILFAIAAILLGVYITRIENKVIHIREENESLLKQTVKNKEEVVSINNLIQKDTYGLYLKIKREETIHMLNRLLTIPQDIINLLELLLSRELEKEDFKILKEAYIKTKNLPKEQRKLFSVGLNYIDSYKLLFFQHFLDLALKDKDISGDLNTFYYSGINCSFENDIIKSTKDFINAIVDLGYKTKGEAISSFMQGLSKSKYNNNETVYKIIFDGLKNRNDQFKFFDLILDDDESLVGKSNYGKLLFSTYSATEFSLEEKVIIDKTNAILGTLAKKEEIERNRSEEQKIALSALEEQS